MKQSNIIFFSVLWLSIIILIAQNTAPSEYSIIHNTISELASQDYMYSWLVKAGVISFGLLLFFSFMLPMGSKDVRHRRGDISIKLFSLHMIGVGIFDTEPFLNVKYYTTTESVFHAIAATFAGFFFVLSMVMYQQIIPKTEKYFTWICIIAILFLSTLFGLSQINITIVGKGLSQRLTLMVGSVWLVWFYSNYTRFSSHSSRDTQTRQSTTQLQQESL